MGTIRRLTDIQLASINSTKLLSVTSSEILYTIGSGNRAFEATNHGPQTVYYGQSNLGVNSGGIITANGSKFWDTITDDFFMYFRASSGGTTSTLVIQEYGGNQ